MLFSSLWVWKAETTAGCHCMPHVAHCRKLSNFGRHAVVHVRHLALIFLLASPAFAGDGVPLQGSAFLGDEDCAGGLKSDACVLSFQLSGKAAKLLFDGMRGKAVKEECTGGMEKSDGQGLHCIKSADGTYDCDFGYSFSGKAFTGSSVDC
jgi:hypothetical protein